MIKQEAVRLLKQSGIDANIEMLEVPPKEEMGDVSFPCFELAKIKKANPTIIASEICAKLKPQISGSALILNVVAIGGYVNFFARKMVLAEKVLRNIIQQAMIMGSQ